MSETNQGEEIITAQQNVQAITDALNTGTIPERSHLALTSQDQKEYQKTGIGLFHLFEDFFKTDGVDALCRRIGQKNNWLIDFAHYPDILLIPAIKPQDLHHVLGYVGLGLNENSQYKTLHLCLICPMTLARIITPEEQINQVEHAYGGEDWITTGRSTVYRKMIPQDISRVFDMMISCIVILTDAMISEMQSDALGSTKDVQMLIKAMNEATKSIERVMN